MYSEKRVAGGVGQSHEPKLSVCCLHISAHPFLAKNRPGAPVFGHCPKKNNEARHRNVVAAIIVCTAVGAVQQVGQI